MKPAQPQRRSKALLSSLFVGLVVGSFGACANSESLPPGGGAGSAGVGGFTFDAGPDSSADAVGEAGAAGSGGDSGADASVDADAGQDGSAGDAAQDGPGDAPLDVVTIPGLMAYYTFDEASGTVFDTSGNGNHGTVQGAAVSQGSSGKIGQAISFSGLDGRVVVPQSTSLNFSTAATIEFWVRVNSVLQGTIISRGTGNNDSHVRIRTNQGNVQVSFGQAGGGAATLISTPNVLTSQWKHVAVVNDGSSLRLYINGALTEQGAGGKLVALFPDLHFGKGAATSDLAFNGSLDDLKWWNVARTQQEICSDAGGTWTPQDGGNSCVL